MFQALSKFLKQLRHKEAVLDEHIKREPNFGDKLARQAAKGRIGVCHK